MSKITINPSQVIGLSPQLRVVASKLSQIEGSITSVKNSIDYRILARTQVRPQLTEASQSIDQVEEKIKRMQTFLNLSVTRYSSTERYLNSSFMAMESVRNMKPVKPGENGKKAESAKSKNTDTSSLVHKVLTYFQSVNQGVSYGNIALVGSQVLSVATSTFLMRNLKINYIGGKPTWKQKFFGQYKFTVTAKPSWTSKTGYSSKIANAIHKFTRSTPTNPILKKVHSFVSSYRGPAAMLKHAAGFSKNVNAAMHGTTLMGRFHKRITIGSKEVVQNIAKSKGFTSVAKRVPLLGNFVSIAANATEVFSPENAKLSVGEKIGRFGAGTTADFVAIGAGAKLGAMAGSVAGPVGIVVGGAVGGLVGGIASSAAGDFIKDVGQKVGGAVEKGVKSVFKSVKSWFN